MSKSYWLDRALVVSPYYYRLCITEIDFKKEMRLLKVPVEHWPNWIKGTANATANFFEKGDGNLCCIICIDAKKHHSLEQVHSLLVHECVHLWQEIREHIGEKLPSSEFEAYAIQALSQRLFESYKEQRKAK